MYSVCQLKYTKSISAFQFDIFPPEWVKICEDEGGKNPFTFRPLFFSLFHLCLSLIFCSNRGKIIRSREVHGSKGHLGHVAVFMYFCVLEIWEWGRAEAFRDAAFIIHDTPPWTSGTLALYSVCVCGCVCVSGVGVCLVVQSHSLDW